MNWWLLFGCAIATWIAWLLFSSWRRRAHLALPPLPGRKRYCLISGAASGIGLATARLFLQRGWHVGAFDVNEEGLKKEFGGLAPEEVTFGYLDVSDASACQTALATLLEASNGKLDLLFNCAGLLTIAPFRDIPLARQLAMVRVNVDGVVNLTHASLDALRTTVCMYVCMYVCTGMYVRTQDTNH